MEVKSEPQESEDIEVLEEVTQTQQQENSVSQPDNVLAMRQLLSGIINSPTQQHLKKAIDWVNNNLISVEKMECFLEMKDFYQYFCIISESAITETNLNSVVSELTTFYEKIISVCFQINCISKHFEDNRLFNLIQLILKRLITEREPNPMGVQPSDSEVLTKCIPLMFSSMIIIVSTFHGFKKVIEISKPITDYVMKFKLECVSDHWKQLIQQLLIVSKIAKRINDTNQTDVESLTPFTLNYLDTFLGNNPFNSHMTHKAIRYFCIERQISLDQLFIELQSDISGHVLRLIDINSNFENLKELLQKAMSFFGINTVPYELMRHIVPHFVVNCDLKTELFIKEMSRIDGKNVSDVILTYLTDIIRQMFYSNKMRKTLENIEKVMTNISMASNSDIEYRIKFLSSDLISHYLLFISIDYNSTLEVIAYINYLKNEKDSKYQLNYYSNKESELRNTLRELFLNFVHKFEFKIQDNSICHKEKMVFLESFVLLLEFMDKNCINTYRVKLFSTLKLIVSDRFCHNMGFIKMSIEGMTAFIKKVDNTYLSSQLLTISALTLRLIQYNSEEPLVIFRELIIKQKSNPLFQSAFKNLYFIPELNQLEEVTEVLRPYITYNDKEEEEICEKISLVVNNLNHENSSVQFFSLQELSKLLRKHQNLIYEKCDNCKELDFDYFVNHIISQLMVCLKSTDKDVLSSAAECIGILGAIDPLRVDLEKPIISRERKSEKFLNFNEKHFKILLITRLYRAITTATQTVDQYCASYALQEVVKTFTEDKETGIRLEELSEELRDFCSILLNTKYSQKSILTVSDSQIEKSKPIFGSTPNMTYAEWLIDWITFLFESFILKNENNEENELKAISSLLSQSSEMGSDYFDAELAKNLNNYAIKTKVLRFCSQIILRNQSIAKFLLPYIVISALKYATPPQRQVIVNEIQQIITTLTTDKCIFDDELGHLSSQTVFNIFDHLKVWHKYRVKLHNQICATERHKKRTRNKDREFRGVQSFLDGISHKELAKLAFKCNAFSRSLRYLEEYIKSNEEKKENKIKNLFQNEIPFFQNVFIRLEDPDSVEGCNSKRNPNNPTLNEMILTHEAMGQFQEALICCEKAISLDPNDFECQRKYLQISMDSFDQSAMVRTYGMGLILNRPEWRPKLAPFIIEAVWRLGDWKQLGTLLEQNDINLNNNFGAGIGDLFHKMISKKELNEFDQKVSSLRQTLIGPLSAAATEISGYVRGHKYIVDLHILHDINHIYNEIIIDLSEDVVSIENMKTKFFKLIDIWDDRTDLVRNTTKNREPILNAQRALLGVLSNRCSDLSPLIKKELFNLWLKSTKTARKSGNIQRSYNCLLEMNKIRESLLKEFVGDCLLNDIENCEAIIETAKIQWNKNNSIGAIQYLKNEIERNYFKEMEFVYNIAVEGLGDRFGPEELNEIRNSLSFGSSSFNGSSQGMELLPTSSTSSSSSRSDDESNEAFAKLQLLYAKYCDKSGVLNQNSLSVLYRSVKVAAPKWEESHYNLGLYYNKILTNYEKTKRNNKTFSLGKPEEILEVKGKIVQSLVESLKYGVKHAHNSLPLMLNIWLDLGSDYHNIKNKDRGVNTQLLAEEMRKTVEKMCNSISALLATAPLFIFFSSFAQLTARVLHPMPSITGVLKRILIKLIIGFPQQSMWLLMRSIHSQNLNRKNFFKELLNRAMIEDSTGHLRKFIPDILKFAKLMTEMCQKNFDLKVKDLSLRKDFSDLHKLFSRSTNFSEILLPFGLLVNVTLPKSFYEKDYNPFPSKPIFIRSIDDSIDLMHSLQRPKKIKINGTDGKTYTILCKPGDDLRKDFCLIEFCNLLNRCFKRDPEARRRQLKVKTYLVISLSDTCGLIEWIPGLLPFRSLVEEQYQLIMDYSTIRESVHKSFPAYSQNIKLRVKHFENEVLPKFKPPVFGNWFLSTYTDPLSWFSARQAYTRSSAVFSIVGYLLGLGDRHGENILIEELTGETVHVDLNCMFNKGEEFAVPERVPFRLTHNMVHGMGVTEFEGTFRKACEHTLRVARDNKEALLNFVRPFRYDHLIDWTKNNSQSRSSCFESNLEQAEKVVFNIEARLNGIPSRNEKKLPKGIPLSVEGQVDHIIKEATDVNNLGLMYLGWTAYI